MWVDFSDFLQFVNGLFDDLKIAKKVSGST